jgi:flagellin-like hook-associated protein FlgL
MTISGTGFGASWANWAPQTLTKIHNDLDTASLQMATGKVSTNYAGLGNSVYESLSLQSRLSAFDTYSSSISTSKTDIQTATDALTSLASLSSSTQSSALAPVNSGDSTNRSARQSELQTAFSSALSYLNSEGSGGYVFSGSDVSNQPVLDSSQILNGDPSTGKDGLSTLITQRQSADLGSDGLGRMTLSNSNAAVTLASPSSGFPFGMSIKSVTSTFTSGAASLSSSQPPTMTADFSTGSPKSGDSVVITLNLPDGTTTDVTMTAGGSNGNGTFAIGTSGADTASNFQSALTTTLKQVGNVQLANASAIKQATDFFSASTSSPPQRIIPGADGSYASATSFSTDAVANSAKTIVWYSGTDANNGTDPLQDRLAHVGDGVSVGYGVRGNQQGFVETLTALAVASATTVSSSDETLAESQFQDLISRAGTKLTSGSQDIQSIVASLGSSQSAINSAQDNNTASQNVLQTTFDALTSVTPEKVAAEVSSLQTQLQVAYQVTANLMKMTLANYL